jgi:uncharacterized protein (TIGR00369 family)
MNRLSVGVVGQSREAGAILGRQNGRGLTPFVLEHNETDGSSTLWCHCGGVATALTTFARAPHGRSGGVVRRFRVLRNRSLAGACPGTVGWAIIDVYVNVNLSHDSLAVPYSDKVTQQQDGFHGGAMGAVADIAGGYAALTVAPEGMEVVTAEYKINFLGSFQGGALRATGRVVKPGKRLIIATAEGGPCRPRRQGGALRHHATDPGAHTQDILTGLRWRSAATLQGDPS